MAKVRVYELAKELNVDSKKLVEDLNAAGIDVKNYMSTLDDDAVAQARKLGSSPVAEVIEEKRVKPTVIRRRKRRVEVEESVAAEAVPPAEEAPPEVEAPEEAPVSVQMEAEAEAQVEASAPPAVEEAPVEEAPPPAEEALRAEAAVEEPSVPEEIPEVEEAIEAKEPLPVEETAAPREEVAEAVQAVEEPEPAGKAEEAERAPMEAEAEEPVQAAPAAETVPPVREGKPKGKKSKKKKMDQPAKIIKRAEEGPLRDLIAKEAAEEAEGEEAPAPAARAMTPAEIARDVAEKAKKSKPARKRKDRKVEEAEEAAEKRKARKKEVYERADLYQGRAKRKDKKGGKPGREAPKRSRQTEITVPKAIKRRIKFQESATVGELAKAMGVKSADLIRKLLEQGLMANINQSLDYETASLVADDFGYELEREVFEDAAILAETEDRPEDLVPRPPVVTIMGHVDHGKTSLLDYIRNSKITEGESGGITQHIGAYYVRTDGGDIVFLDTPGHEAFTAMRARGAKVTDLIVLVVAADDGVMPQTREAINHARAAQIPIVVAVNKIDKPEANIDRVKRELAELDLVPEEWGGQVIFGYISAKTGEGVDDLLGLILLQAEIMELRGNPNKAGRGIVIEAQLDKSKGPVATVLNKNGMLRPGDYIIIGDYYGHVRAMANHRGAKVDKAGPSVPVEIYGINGVPMAGDEFAVVPDEKTAKTIIEHRKGRTRPQEAKRGLVSLDDLFDRIKEGEVKELNIVLKTDVQGSLEALADSLVKLSTEEVKLKIIHSATGAITESDVMLAAASGAIILGFNVRANPRVRDIAEKEQVDIRYYDVIYNAIKDIRLAMAGLLEPVYKEQVIGRAEIRETFKIPKVGVIAGCQVTDGHVERNARVRLLRDDVVIFDGRLASLRRFKEDVKDVQTGYECGIGLENFQDIKTGDVVEAYQVEEVAAEL
ncbi:translation initiation factor IF-2 [uncultured Desulfatiglans sp.]|nr:translation initiation factor IF-2 [uncultured Desulfatiglans sp.]